jgi:hypothetical protein
LSDSAESDEYKISLEDGLLIDSLVISNKGSYSATVRKADAYFGTTFDPVPLGDAKYGLRVERVE